LELEKEGMIQGVLDDRGKYIYVTDDEFKAISSFIRRKGRVTVQEIVSECNRVINPDRQATDDDIKLTDEIKELE
jgi:hypothetical protein